MAQVPCLLLMVQGLVRRQGVVHQDRLGTGKLPRGPHHLSGRRRHQLPLALRQVARLLLGHQEPADLGGIRNLLCRRQAHRQVLQREPHAREIRRSGSRLLQGTRRHRGRTLLQAHRHRPHRRVRRRQGRPAPPQRARSLHHHPAAGEEHVPRALAVLHRPARQDSRAAHPHREEQGVDHRSQAGDHLQQEGNHHHVRQHRGLRKQLLRHQDRGKDLLQHHPRRADHRPGGSARGNAQGNHLLQSPHQSREQSGTQEHRII